MTKQGYEAYKMYLALQRHFSTNYDYFKYNGKVNASAAAYEKRQDAFSFEKLVKIVQPEQLQDFYVCHFLDNPKCWIRSMSRSNYDTYKAVIKNFSKTFRDDCEVLSQQHLPSLMKVDGDIPLIHKMCINKQVSIESLIAIDKFYPFIDKHEEAVTVPFVFPDHIMKLKKYRPFFDKHITDIHKDIMKNAFIGDK